MKRLNDKYDVPARPIGENHRRTRKQDRTRVLIWEQSIHSGMLTSDPPLAELRKRQADRERRNSHWLRIILFYRERKCGGGRRTNELVPDGLRDEDWFEITILPLCFHWGILYAHFVKKFQLLDIGEYIVCQKYVRKIFLWPTIPI